MMRRPNRTTPGARPAAIISYIVEMGMPCSRCVSRTVASVGLVSWLLDGSAEGWRVVRSTIEKSCAAMVYSPCEIGFHGKQMCDKIVMPSQVDHTSLPGKSLHRSGFSVALRYSPEVGGQIQSSEMLYCAQGSTAPSCSVRLSSERPPWKVGAPSSFCYSSVDPTDIASR